jgi:hypothetical protein
VKWTTLGYESFVSTEGATLSRSGDVIISGGAKPDKDSYVITSVTLSRSPRCGSM